MFLQEEYLKKHNLTQEVPVLPYVTKGSLLLTDRNLITINWDIFSSRPGSYIVSFLSPIHNGYTKRNFWEKYKKEVKLQYEEYQDYMMTFFEFVPTKPISTQKEVELTAWRIFLYIFDSWLVRNANSTLNQLIYNSVANEENIEFQYVNFQRALSNLQDNFLLVYRVFDDSIMKMMFPYLYWTASLFDFCKKSG